MHYWANFSSLELIFAKFCKHLLNLTNFAKFFQNLPNSDKFLLTLFYEKIENFAAGKIMTGPCRRCPYHASSTGRMRPAGCGPRSPHRPLPDSRTIGTRWHRRVRAATPAVLEPQPARPVPRASLPKLATSRFAASAARLDAAASTARQGRDWRRGVAARNMVALRDTVVKKVYCKNKGYCN